MTNPTIGKLRGIFFKAAGGISDNANEEIAEVIAWALEAVGEDELHMNYCISMGGDCICGASARNQLRREIRAKLTGGKP